MASYCLVVASHFSAWPSLLHAASDSGISEEASAGMSGYGVPAITPIGTRGDIFKDSCVVDNLLFASAFSTMSSSA